MTLREMSRTIYQADAKVFDERITLLYAALHRTESKEMRDVLRKRIEELKLLRRQSNELAEVTRRYYERGYHRDERYTL